MLSSPSKTGIQPQIHSALLPWDPSFSLGFGVGPRAGSMLQVTLITFFYIYIYIKDLGVSYSIVFRSAYQEATSLLMDVFGSLLGDEGSRRKRE